MIQRSCSHYAKRALGNDRYDPRLTDAQGITTYLPAIDIDGTQWTLQTIRKDGTKLFQKNSRKEGTFHVVGGDLVSLEPLVFLVMAEGYATSVILSEAVRQPTIAAFDAGNLPAVASALRARWPTKPILIAGDDDHGVELREGYNPGRDKAIAAAELVNGAAVFPMFAPGEQESDPKGFTDFHDLAVRSQVGREGVRLQIEAALEGLIVPPAGGMRKEADMIDERAARNDDEKDREPPPRPRPAVEPDPTERMPHDAIDRALTASNGIAGGPEPDRDGRDGPSARAAVSYEVGDVPEDLVGRYRTETSRWRLQRDYYESNMAPRPIFHDQGRRLVTEIESAAVIADMVAIAEHRGWSTIEVSGTTEFRRDTWVRAQAAGLDVRGYQPTERDRQEVSQVTRRAPRATGIDEERTPDRSASDTNRLYLTVPFAEKELAKAAGAKWDRTARSWYAADTARDAVAKWIPNPAVADVDRTIAGDRAAREQMRTIEAVVGVTLANDPEAAQRVVRAGREALAAKVERGEPITAPTFRSERAVPDQILTSPPDPALSTRRPPNRTRSR